MFLFSVGEPLEVRMAYHVPSPGRNPYEISLAGGGRSQGTDASAGADPFGTFGVRLEPRVEGKLRLDRVYILPHRQFVDAVAECSRRGRVSGHLPGARAYTGASAARILSLKGMPLRLGSRASAGATCNCVAGMASITRGTLRLAIVNAYGQQFGDAILLMSVLRELAFRIAEIGRRFEVDLLQHPGNSEAEELLSACGLVHTIRHLPLPIAELSRYDAYWDLTDNVIPDDVHWADDLMARMGLDSDSVSAEGKRCYMPCRSAASRQDIGCLLNDVRTSGAPVALFHARASAGVRSLRPVIARGLLERILGMTDWTVVSAHPIAVDHPRYFDVSGQTPDFDHFAELVSQVDLFVSVDTCVPHIADANDVPGVVLFTDVPPDLRIRYYPHVAGLTVPPAMRRSGHQTPRNGELQALAERAVSSVRAKVGERERGPVRSRGLGEGEMR